MRWLVAGTIVALAVLFGGPSTGALAAEEGGALDVLFERLKATDDPAEAKAVEQKIWHEWVLGGSDTIDLLMAKGIREMEGGAHEAAVETFSAIIALEPEFPEGWNKRATVHFLMGNFDASVRDIEKTLELEPRHFGALSGLGMIYETLDRKEAAMRAFEAAHGINPHIEGMGRKIRDLRRQVEGDKI